MQQPEENLDNWEDTLPFSYGLYKILAPHIKQFLVNYLGAALTNAEAQTFRDIEQVIKENIYLYADMIPDHLYRNRTIKDVDKWEEAFDNYVHDPTIVFPWPPDEEPWRIVPEDEDDEDEELDLPEQAQKIVDAADTFISGHNQFAAFMNGCSQVITRETKLYLETDSPFDLVTLTPEGYITVADRINSLAEDIAENLYTVVANI